MSWMLAALRLLAMALAGHVQFGVATNFAADGDPWNPNPLLYCTNRKLDDERDLVVAHPKAPCGSRVWIHAPRTGRSAWATVADRGPRRAMIDLAPALARKLKANGMEQVVVVWSQRPRGFSAKVPIKRSTCCWSTP